MCLIAPNGCCFFNRHPLGKRILCFLLSVRALLNQSLVFYHSLATTGSITRLVLCLYSWLVFWLPSSFTPYISTEDDPGNSTRACEGALSQINQSESTPLTPASATTASIYTSEFTPTSASPAPPLRRPPWPGRAGPGSRIATGAAAARARHMREAVTRPGRSWSSRAGRAKRARPG